MKRAMARLARDRMLLTGAVLAVAFGIVALAAPLIAPYDPYTMGTARALESPSAAHWFGTDQFGRDQLSRIVHGARISLKVAFASAGLALAAGTLLGLLAGYFGRLIDQALSRLTDIMFAFPDIILALALMAVLGPATRNLILAIAIVYTPIYMRIARAATLEVGRAQYVEAARAMGAPTPRILLRHVLPNIWPPLIVQTTLSLAFAILSEAALSFLGLGIEPDAPSWGIMLKDGKDLMRQAWWLAVFPGLAITLAVLGFNLFGDSLRDALDPRRPG